MDSQVSAATTTGRALQRRDVLLYCISAILLLDTVAASAAIGVAGISWWLILGAAFFVPFALISVELGCAYPDRGGIYGWVDRAFGGRWAGRVAWYYWINVAVWCPSIYILFAGMVSQWLGLHLSLLAQVVIGLALAWATVFVNWLTLDVGKWVPNVGAVLKLLVFVALIAGAFVLGGSDGAPPPNAFSAETLLPSWNSGLQFVPVIVYGMVGFELICAASDELDDPAHSLPGAMLISGGVILLFYVLSTLAVLVALPAAEINLVEGLVDTFRLFFAELPGGGFLVGALTLGTLFTLFSNGVTWALGANRAAAAAADAGHLPALFGHTDPVRHTPMGAALALGVASSLILLLYAATATSNEDLFWSLFAFSGVIFFLPYVAMMFAYIRLNARDQATPRPFRFAARGLGNGAAGLCALILVFSIVLFLVVPGEGVQWPVLLGSVALIGLGEILIPRRTRKSHD